MCEGNYSTHIATRRHKMIAVYEIHNADGSLNGCGTALEFEYWADFGLYGEGAYLGKVICHEDASLDEARKLQWATA